MKIKKIGNKSCLYYRDEEDLALHSRIEGKNYRYIKTLKEDGRSHVFLIEIQNKKYVVKVPLEKNRRGWQRFISIFRGGESKREFKNCERILELGFKGPVPILSWEKISCGMVVDSYSVASYIEGKGTTVEHIEPVMKVLGDIHERGFLHGDSHLGNFMISHEEIFLIDCKLMRNLTGTFGRAYEIKYLENSCHNGWKLYDGEDIYYWTAVKRDELYHWWRRFKNKIRGR